MQSHFPACGDEEMKAMSTKATGMFAAEVAALAELAPETTELWQTKGEE